MWTTIISQNFKELLDTLTKRPTTVLLIAVIFTSGFFIDKWVSSKDDSAIDLKAKDAEILEVTKEMLEFKYQYLYYKDLLEDNKNKTDSILNESNQLIKNMIQKQK